MTIDFDAVQTVSAEQPNTVGQMRDVTLENSHGVIVGTIPAHIAIAIARIVIASLPAHKLPGTISTDAMTPRSSP